MDTPREPGKETLAETFLTTKQVIYLTGKPRHQACWHCRTWRRLLRLRKHWACNPRPPLTYLTAKPRDIALEYGPYRRPPVTGG